ncbi:MAG: hypothetical protein Q7R41_07135 [Phycisphaerales bacterium]|nr:hypothetical protein [Phycisphaerales bacterium]
MLSLVGSQVLLAGFGGTCIPDNLFAETAGEIVNGLIITGVNMILAGGGIAI